MAVIIKTVEEIGKIKEANQIIARLYENILPSYIKPGISTKELNEKIETYIKSQGAIPGTIGVPGLIAPFPYGSCISVNEAVVHGIPSEKIILKEGDIVSIDTVTILDGYYGDGAITYPVGKIDEKAKKLL